MIFVALIDVDADKLKKVRESYDDPDGYDSTGSRMEAEFGWLEGSGIYLRDYVGWEDESDIENERVLISGENLELL